jgi:hypothetical protein
MSETKIRLRCIKVGGKLRVRILTPGYYNSANCQFPRDLRIEGTSYDVDANAICLITRAKNYYSITHRPSITVLPYTVFEDQSSDDCAICMSNEKCMVIVPCGHYYTCAECTEKITMCPICRNPFKSTINKSLMT